MVLMRAVLLGSLPSTLYRFLLRLSFFPPAIASGSSSSLPDITSSKTSTAGGIAGSNISSVAGR